MKIVNLIFYVFAAIMFIWSSLSDSFDTKSVVFWGFIMIVNQLAFYNEVSRDRAL